MKKYKLHLRYLYTFFRFDEIEADEVIDEKIEIEDSSKRLSLYLGEDSTYLLSPLREDSLGKFVILTMPNKDNLIIREGEETELLYDEYFDAMGDNNHNVYEGLATLILE